jgi:hypothetical protein
LNTTGSTGSTGAGSNNTARSFKSNIGLGNTGVGTSGAGTNFQNQNLLKNKNLGNLNQTQTNHTPTFTNPAIVTTPKKTIGGVGSNTSTGLNTNTGVNTHNLLNKNKNNVQLNQNLNNLNNVNNLIITSTESGDQPVSAFRKQDRALCGAPSMEPVAPANEAGADPEAERPHHNQTFFGNKGVFWPPLIPAQLPAAFSFTTALERSAWGWG